MKLALSALAPLLLLVACAAGGVGGPAPVAPARGAATPAEHPLVMRCWPARGPARAVILGLHGFGDAAELTFEGAARDWSARGITTCAFDQRGFGANPSRKRWPGPDALIADAVAAAADLRRRHPGPPLVVVGESMGGGVALAATTAGLDADGLVLVSPAIAGGDALNPVLRATAWTAAATLPEKRWRGGGIVKIRPTDNLELLAEVAADPRHYADPSSRELYGLVALMDRAAAAAPAARIPTLTLTGAHDEVLDPARIAGVQALIPGRAGYIDYPDGWHWLLRDLQAERVWRDIADFTLRTPRRD